MSEHYPLSVLITRPLADAEPLAELLRAQGYIAHVAPMMEIRHRDSSDVELETAIHHHPDAILITSANGIRALAQATKRRDIPVVVIGQASLEAAKRLGFQKVASAASGDAANVDLLCDYVLNHFPLTSYLVHISGSSITGNLQGRLNREGYRVERVVLYEAMPIADFPQDAIDAFNRAEVDAVLFYSARTAGIFLKQIQNARLQDAIPFLNAVCLSPAIVEEVSQMGWGRIYCAEFPTTDHVLKILGTIQAKNAKQWL